MTYELVQLNNTGFIYTYTVNVRVLLFVFFSAIMSCLFLAALWSHIGIELTSWLSCMCCSLCFSHFPMLCPGPGVVLNCIDS